MTVNIKNYTQFLTERWSGDSITVFDVDDTLTISNAKIKVHDPASGEYFELTPKQFNDYKKDPGHKLDFSDFKSKEILKAGKIIDSVMDILKETIKREKAVGIITARDDKDLIIDFLLHNGVDVNPDFIFAINEPNSGFTGSIAVKKQQAFERFIKMGFKNFKFYDDDRENLKLAKDLERKYDINMEINHVTHDMIDK
jgi:hypothetical protein